MRRHIQTGFMAGELDPHLDGRIDTEQYAFGLATCENWVAINEGPLVKRQGFERVGSADDTAAWLTAFRPSITQEYVLEWGEQTLRFYTNEAPLLSAPDAPFVVATPYTVSDVPFVSSHQSFDRLYLAHEKHPPSALRRDTPSTFTFETIDNQNGPFLDTNSDESRVVSASGVIGNITLSGNAGFADGHVGALIRLEAKDFANITQWEGGMKDVAIGDKVRNRGNVYQAATAGTTGSVEPEHTEGSYFDGQLKKDLLNDKGPFGVKWTHLHGLFGVAQITSVASANSAQATVLRRLPDSLTSVATYKWAHQAFSEAEGWPSLVTIKFGRLIHVTPLDVFGSVSGDFGGGRVNWSQFTDGGLRATDLAFRRTVGFVDQPLWISNDRGLLVGTPSVEMAIRPLNSSEAFSGTNIEAEEQSFYGSEQVFPVKQGTETLFVERGGRRIRAADYDFGRDRYDAKDLNATSREITRERIVQLARQQVPHAFGFGLRGDGKVICHAKTRADISGFTRWILGGGARALSIVSAVNSNGKTEDLWALIERENSAGQTVKEVWRQTAWRELGTPTQESFYVDGGTRIEASGGSFQFSGFEHFAGQDVAILAGGVVIPSVTVSAQGEVTLPQGDVPEDDYTLVVGLGYSAIARSMRPEPRDRQPSLVGLRQRATKTIVRVLETLGLKSQAIDQSTPEELILRRAGQSMDQQIPLVDGDIEALIDSTFDRDGRITWRSDDPLPATIALVVQNIEESNSDA